MNFKKMFIILGLSLAFANTAMANEETAPLAHISGIITSPFEYDHGNHGHTGVDILYRVGTPLYAPISGKVEFLAGEGMDGDILIIQNEEVGDAVIIAGVDTDILTKTTVKAGEVVATATREPIHFEYRQSGYPLDPVNPLPFLQLNGTVLEKTK